MKSMFRCGWMVAVLVTGMVFLVGCGDEKTKTKASGLNSKTDGVTDTGGPHSGFWCKEHGVPEAICSICNKKYAQECKDKGDWCKEHNRAESQCFICDPSRKEKFAAMYRAQYPGKEPPPMEE